MFKHEHDMALKTLTITKEAYNEINSLKKNNESFSELFKRLKKERRANNIDRFFGVLKNSPLKIDDLKRKLSESKKENMLLEEKKRSKIKQKMKELRI
ncbi:hypothetical protein J4232_04845 [Candidatus Woesearchaeota archaeon]|nr:hypothetical protein [Candidatus Woesearchaeota archaeon]